MEAYNITVVIPTWNRECLVGKLLRSLLEDRNTYEYGDTEVLIVDSSKGKEKAAIEQYCKEYNAEYICGEDSVRKKRNLGIKKANYEYILFLDSDVEVKTGMLNEHMKVHVESENPLLGGSFGVTEFVGESNFVWKIIEYSTFIDSFGFAKKFPYQNWTIGNNVMFKKEILLKTGMFEENFPYRLGGDDLELSYRITHKGYLIQSVPKAVTYHSKETWKRWITIKDRVKRWGSMEYYLQKKHPEIFITRIPKAELIFAVTAIILGIVSLVFFSWKPIILWGLFFVLSCMGIYFLDTKDNDKKNPIYYFMAKYLECKYYYYHISEGLKNRSACGIYKCLSFSAMQTKFMLIRETKKLWIIILSLCISGFLSL